MTRSPGGARRGGGSRPGFRYTQADGPSGMADKNMGSGEFEECAVSVDSK